MQIRKEKAEIKEKLFEVHYRIGMLSENCVYLSEDFEKGCQVAVVEKENMKMLFDPKPVSFEEYNSTLRSSVNAYYEHAMNDSSMSKEEAIKSTMEMSEQYIDAVQEFQEAQESRNATSVDANEDIQAIEYNGIQEDSNAVSDLSADYTLSDFSGEPYISAENENDISDDVLEDSISGGIDDGGLDF